MDFFFFFQAEDGIRDGRVTGVQTCALPIFSSAAPDRRWQRANSRAPAGRRAEPEAGARPCRSARPARSARAGADLGGGRRALGGAGTVAAAAKAVGAASVRCEAAAHLAPRWSARRDGLAAAQGAAERLARRRVRGLAASLFYDFGGGPGQHPETCGPAQ